MVAVVLFLFLLNVRTTAITLITIPFAVDLCDRVQNDGFEHQHHDIGWPGGGHR